MWGFFLTKMNYFNTMEEVNIFYNIIEHELHTKGSCIVHGSNSSDRNRYVQVKKQIRPSRYIWAYIHQVALLKKMNMFRIPEGLESSHLCHNKSCVYPEHLAAEPHNINLARVACVHERTARALPSFALGMKDIPNAYRSKYIASKMKRTPLLYWYPIRVEWHHMNAPVVISL